MPPQPSVKTRTPATRRKSAAASRTSTPGARTRKSAARTGNDPSELFDFQKDSLGYALRRAQMRAYDLFFEMLSETGLSPARLTALSMIATEPEINQASLAQRLDISGPSVLKMVDSLEAAGLVERLPSDEDRRRYKLLVTTVGRAKLQELRAATARFEESLAQGLSPAERKQLLALLDRVARVVR